MYTKERYIHGNVEEQSSDTIKKCYRQRKENIGVQRLLNCNIVNKSKHLLKSGLEKSLK